MDNRPNLFLITGAQGWLGSYLVETLVKGLTDADKVAKKLPSLRTDPNLRLRCLVLPGQDSTSLASLSERVEVVSGDLRKPEDCARFCAGTQGATLFHTAGIIHPKRVREFYQVNVEGTRNILDAAISAGVKRAVVVSSNSPCGCNPHPDHLFDELSPYHPYMNYGRSKMLMELAVKERQQSGRIETVLIRAPWFYGPNQPPRQTRFFRMIRDGRAPILGRGDNRRSMVYTENLCQGILLAAVNERANGQVYWIADERPYTMSEIIDTVERLLETEFGQKCTHQRLRLPGLIGVIATIADAMLQRVGIYQPEIHVLGETGKTIACSIARARRELGYEPTVALEAGMRRSLEWVFLHYGGIDA